MSLHLSCRHVFSLDGRKIIRGVTDFPPIRGCLVETWYIIHEQHVGMLSDLAGLTNHHVIYDKYLYYR